MKIRVLVRVSSDLGLNCRMNQQFYYFFPLVPILQFEPGRFFWAWKQSILCFFQKESFSFAFNDLYAILSLSSEVDELFGFKTNNQNRVKIKAFFVKDKNVSYLGGKFLPYFRIFLFPRLTKLYGKIKLNDYGVNR